MKSLILVVFLFMSLTSFAQITKTKRDNSFNPLIGMNAMMLMKDSQVDAEGDGFSLQGVEMQFNADIDAYFRAQIVIGIHQEEHDEEEEEEEEHAAYMVHPEEAFVETIAVPNFTFKFGKFLSQFGKYNAVHLHAQPFIYKGVVQEEMFGHEGFGSTGVGVSFLLPASWFSEVQLEALQPENEELFEETAHATAYVMKVKNLWDLNDATTFELGLSGLSFTRPAYNDFDEEKTNLWGADLTFKWRPVEGGKSSSFVWSTEFINKKKEGTTELDNGGITSFIRYQLAPRWFGQAQYENLGINRSDGENYAHTNTALVGFAPSEFSVVRLQYDLIKMNEDEEEKRLSLQLNMSMGAHPAHNY